MRNFFHAVIRSSWFVIPVFIVGHISIVPFCNAAMTEWDQSKTESARIVFDQVSKKWFQGDYFNWFKTHSLSDQQNMAKDMGAELSKAFEKAGLGQVSPFIIVSPMSQMFTVSGLNQKKGSEDLQVVLHGGAAGFFSKSINGQILTEVKGKIRMPLAERRTSDLTKDDLMPLLNQPFTDPMVFQNFSGMPITDSEMAKTPTKDTLVQGGKVYTLEPVGNPGTSAMDAGSKDTKQ